MAPWRRSAKPRSCFGSFRSLRSRCLEQDYCPSGGGPSALVRDGGDFVLRTSQWPRRMRADSAQQCVARVCPRGQRVEPPPGSGRARGQRRARVYGLVDDTVSMMVNVAKNLRTEGAVAIFRRCPEPEVPLHFEIRKDLLCKHALRYKASILWEASGEHGCLDNAQ